jgi:TRAP-type C4-dicarboxylate transport system substrate-binding protein
VNVVHDKSIQREQTIHADKGNEYQRRMVALNRFVALEWVHYNHSRWVKLHPDQRWVWKQLTSPIINHQSSEVKLFIDKRIIQHHEHVYTPESSTSSLSSMVKSVLVDDRVSGSSTSTANYMIKQIRKIQY